jgi:hypothetical protein
MIGELKSNKRKISELLENYSVCLEAIHDVLITHDHRQAQYSKKPAQIQNVRKSEYRVVEQKYQFTNWDKWSRKEQIDHSIGIDEADALKGTCCIPTYVFLMLKKE